MASQSDQEDEAHMLHSVGKNSPDQIRGLSLSQTHDILMEGRESRATSSARRFASLTMVAFYSILLGLSWIITVVLSFKPLNSPQWTTSWASPEIGPCYWHERLQAHFFSCDGRDNIMSDDQLNLNARWQQAARVIGAIIAVFTITISSAICARAAVAYLQYQRNEKFRLSKAIALADRGWWDPNLVWKLLHPRFRLLYFDKFILFGTVVCGLGVLIWPLQSLLVTQETTRLVSDRFEAQVLGPDADIFGLHRVESADTISATRNSMESGHFWDTQPNIWRTPESMCNTSASSWTYSCSTSNEGSFTHFHNLMGNSSFVSFVLNTANTGLFEGHSFRFNSSVQCSNVTENMFPQHCDGFSTSSVMNRSHTDEELKSMKFQICAPGNMQRFPWNVTRDRQDIEEEVYLHFNNAAVSYLSNDTNASSWTQRCTAQTSAGYFMLPNRENSTFGPLVDKFDLSTSNDPKMVFDKNNTNMNAPPELTLGEGYPVPDANESPTLGPLLTATIGLFGPSTFFSARANASMNDTWAHNDNCADPVPFYYLSQTGTPGGEDYIPRPACASNIAVNYFQDLNIWFRHLFMGQYSNTESVFTQAVFYANKVSLARAAAMSEYRRILLMDQGTEVKMLRASTASIVCISIIIVLHLVGLTALALYSAKSPTWTETLDAFAMINLGYELKK